MPEPGFKAGKAGWRLAAALRNERGQVGLDELAFGLPGDEAFAGIEGVQEVLLQELRVLVAEGVRALGRPGFG